MNQGRHQASESQQEKRECCRNHQTFAVPHIIGASFPNVEIERYLTCQFELHLCDSGPAIDLEERSLAREAWGRSTRRAFGGGESH